MFDALRAVGSTLQPVLDSVGEGVLVVDSGGTPVIWNSAAARLLGLGSHSRTQTAWTNRTGVLGADGVTHLPGVDRPLPRAIRGEVVDDQEFVLAPPGGVAIQISCTARALRDGNDQIVGGVAIFRDISARKRVEAGLRESEQRYRTLARHLPSTVALMFDRSLHFTLAEGGGLAAAGLTSAQIEGRSVADHATPELIDKYRAVFEGVASESEIERGNGRRYRVQLVPVLDDQAQVFAGLMLAEDVTEHRRREEERRGVEHFKFLAEAIPQIVWTAAPDGELDFYNRQWFDYTGMTLEQTRGWGWAPVLHPDDLDTCVAVWSESVRTGKDYEIQYRFKRACDGTYRWHLGRARAVRDAAGAIIKWFGTCTDIDDQRRAEDALREAHQGLEVRVQERTVQLSALNETLAESLREKEVLLKEVHHRVKNNLQVISSLLKLHAEQVTDPAALVVFQDSQDRVRAIALLHEQLYQSKNLGAVSVASYTGEVIKTLVRANARREVRFTVDAGDVMLPVDAAVPFGLIVNELVTNSLKHGFGTAQLTPPEIRVEIHAIGDWLEVVVTDNGCGFSPQFDPATTTSLGMQLIHALTGQLDGSISFSSPGGAESRLRFPIPADGRVS